MKRTTNSSEESTILPKWRKVNFTTFSKWRTDNDKKWLMVSWLDCIAVVKGRNKMVTALICSVCTKCGTWKKSGIDGTLMKNESLELNR